MKAFVDVDEDLARKPARECGVALPMHVWLPLDAKLWSSKTGVASEKANKLLGYRPVHDFEAGMALTGAWSRSANFLIPG
jgi:nucleoside-diphosphate-sugar epimerase